VCIYTAENLCVQKIRYASSPSGAGKTHGIIKRACELGRDVDRIMILQPTKELISRTIEDELKAQPKRPCWHVFHEDTISHNESVAAEITRFIRDGDSWGQIVSATPQSFHHIGYFPEKGYWHLLIDEELQVLRHKAHRLPNTHSIITDDIELEQCNAVYNQVCPLPSLGEKARNKDEDEILSHLSDTLRILRNSNWQTYVNTEQYRRLLQGKTTTLAFHSMLNPKLFDGFASVFMAAANLEDTAIFQLWNDRVCFDRDEDFCKGLRFPEHENGELITIHFGVDCAWSRKAAETKISADDDSPNVRDRLIDATKQLFGDEPFLWQSNKSLESNPFTGSNGIRLSNKPHGLNTFSEIHNISFVSALNPQPDHFRFLEMQGMSSIAVRRAIYFQNVYQSVLRTSIRNPKDEHPKHIIVPDIEAAEYLQCKFPGSRLDRLDIGIKPASVVIRRTIGRPRKYTSNAERLAGRRQKAREAKLQNVKAQILCQLQHELGSPMSVCQDDMEAGCGWVGQINSPNGRPEKVMSLYHLRSPVLPISSWTDAVLMHELRTDTQPVATLYCDKTQSMPMGYVYCPDDDSFLYLLWQLHKRQVTSKSENNLISPSVFDPSLSGNHKRGRENIKYLKNLWLDFENGDLQPGEFPNLFPNLRMAVINTYSHTAEHPRFRVIIPTSTTMTAETYELMYGQIASKLIDSGYSVERGGKRGRKKKGERRSGLDWGKRSPTSLFYMPCQAQESRHSFFIDYDQPGRVALPVITWLENAPLWQFVPNERPRYQQETILNGGDIDSWRVEKAKAQWRQAPEGTGNDAFFHLGLECKLAGMNSSQIESVLKEEVRFARAHSIKDRKAQIPSILRNLNG